MGAMQPRRGAWELAVGKRGSVAAGWSQESSEDIGGPDDEISGIIPC